MSLTVSFVPWIYQELENPWFKIEKYETAGLFNLSPQAKRGQAVDFASRRTWISQLPPIGCFT